MYCWKCGTEVAELSGARKVLRPTPVPIAIAIFMYARIASITIRNTTTNVVKPRLNGSVTRNE